MLIVAVFLFLFNLLHGLSYAQQNVHLYDVYAYTDLGRKIIVKGKLWDEAVSIKANKKEEFIIPVSIFLNREPFFLFKDKYMKNPRYKRCFINGKTGSNPEIKRAFIILNELVCVDDYGIPTLRKKVKGYVLDKETNLGIGGKVINLEIVKGKKVKAVKIDGGKGVITVFQLK